MQVELEVVKRTSKSNKEYECLEITLPNGYKKLVFLGFDELELLKYKLNESKGLRFK